MSPRHLESFNRRRERDIIKNISITNNMYNVIEKALKRIFIFYLCYEKGITKNMKKQTGEI